MKKIVVKDGIIPNIDSNVACIGYFDGVHKGHQALINFTKYLADSNNIKSMVICFDPDPVDVINPKNKKMHLLSKKDRLSSFEALGIDIVCIIKFTKELMKLSSQDFIKKYLSKMNIDTIVCGYDFSFGYMGKGNSNTLSKYINTVVIDEVSYYGKKISSTRIREAIKEGNFKLANRLLGYEYTIRLKVKFSVQCGSESISEAICVDKNQVLPINSPYDDITILSDHFYFRNILDLSVGDEIILVFKNE